MVFCMKQPCCCSRTCCSFKVCLWVWAVLSLLAIVQIWIPDTAYLEKGKDVDGDTRCWGDLTEKCGQAETYYALQSTVSSLHFIKGVGLSISLVMDSVIGVYGTMGMECLTMIMEFAHYGYGIDKDTEICQGAIQESAEDSNFILPDVCKDDDDNTWNLHCVNNCEHQINITAWIAIFIGIGLTIYILLVLYAYIDALQTQDAGPAMTEIQTNVHGGNPTIAQGSVPSYAQPPTGSQPPPAYNNAPGWANEQVGGTATGGP